MGAAVKGINIFDLKNVYLPTPDIETQKNLAKLLEDREKQIAKSKSSIEGYSKLLKEYRTALITAAVTGQIDVKSYGKSGAVDRHLDQLQDEGRA